MTTIKHIQAIMIGMTTSDPYIVKLTRGTVAPSSIIYGIASSLPSAFQLRGTPVSMQSKFTVKSMVA